VTDAFESRLVWMFGSPRTGSTWLLQLLGHPLVARGGLRVQRIGTARREQADAPIVDVVPVNEPGIPQHLSPLVDPNAGDLATLTINALRRTQPHYFFAESYEEVWRPQLRDLVLSRLRAQAERVAEAFGLTDPLVVVKEPNGSEGSRFVMGLLPESRLLYLVRDGRDVVDSLVDAKSPGGWLHPAWAETDGEPAARRLEMVRRESALWLARTRIVEEAYAAHPPERRHRVRYEDLLADPVGGLAELDAWLGIERDGAARAEAVAMNDFAALPAGSTGSGKVFRAATPGLWRENFTDAEQEAMAEVMGDKLADLGYD
jgi:Sulfotransferase family